MTHSTDGALLTFALTAIAALVLLVTRWRWNSFLALTLTSLLMGGCAVFLRVVPTSNTVAWTFPGVLETFQSGLGKTLGSVAPPVILGAILGRVLAGSGVARVLGGLAAEAHRPVLLYAWLTAAFIRVATDSATVALTVAAELIAPLITQGGAVNRKLLVLAIGFGSLFLSHFNDGGFWIVKESLSLNVRETLQTWTIIGIAGLLLTLLAAALLSS
jgi:H+/gluconate symporter-like permease